MKNQLVEFTTDSGQKIKGVVLDKITVSGTRLSPHTNYLIVDNLDDVHVVNPFAIKKIFPLLKRKITHQETKTTKNETSN